MSVSYVERDQADAETLAFYDKSEDRFQSLMKQHGFEYTKRNISEPEVMIEFRERLPRARALLQIFADGKHLGGLEDLQFHLKE